MQRQWHYPSLGYLLSCLKLSLEVEALVLLPTGMLLQLVYLPVILSLHNQSY